MFRLILVVDVSGSMASYTSHVVGAINRLIDIQKKSGGEPCGLTIFKFSNCADVVVDVDDAAACKRQCEKDYQAGGGTALLDAMALAFDRLGEGRGMIVALTDGEENVSKHVLADIAGAISVASVAGNDCIYAVMSPCGNTRQACMQYATQLGFGMIYGCTPETINRAVDDIGMLVTRVRNRGRPINYAVNLAKTGYATVMRAGKYSARLMRAPRRTKKEGGLPPGAPVPVFPVDALPGCPPHWTGGEGSYVCPVSPDEGLWFDFSLNDAMNTAILCSVKGMNPITGRKIANLRLERRGEKCPVHGKPLMAGGLCDKCGHKHPPQNYLAWPNEPWMDGFRQNDGTVRQFVFSADEARDVASAKIGKQNTVPAFGFAFFATKKKREGAPSDYMPGGWASLRPVGIIRGLSGHTGPVGHAGPSGQSVYADNSSQYYCTPTPSPNILNAHTLYSIAPPAPPSVHPYDLAPYDVSAARGGSSSRNAPQFQSLAEPTSCFMMSVAPVSMAMQRPTAGADVSVAAGAQIDQDLEEDELEPEDWSGEPKAICRLYFVFAEEFEAILKRGGIRDLKGNPEGYLKGVPVG